jgi:hypothetical protein
MVGVHQKNLMVWRAQKKKKVMRGSTKRIHGGGAQKKKTVDSRSTKKLMVGEAQKITHGGGVQKRTDGRGAKKNS